MVIERFGRGQGSDRDEPENSTQGAVMSDDLNDVLARFRSSVGGRTLVENQWYADTTVSLDGYHFHKCRFDRCSLRYASGDFELSYCVFGEGTKVRHPKLGARIIRLFHTSFPILDAMWPSLAPRRHENSAFTVNDVPGSA